jgi:hypothetical protein
MSKAFPIDAILSNDEFLRLLMASKTKVTVSGTDTVFTDVVIRNYDEHGIYCMDDTCLVYMHYRNITAIKVKRSDVEPDSEKEATLLRDKLGEFVGIGLSSKTIDALIRNDITTLNDLAEITEDELMKKVEDAITIGELYRLYERLDEWGIKLKAQPEDGSHCRYSLSTSIKA